MSDPSGSNSQTLFALQRFTRKFDGQENELGEFMRRQANGEQQDPELFASLLKQRAVTHQAMQVEIKLTEKPLKTALNEAK